MNSTPDGPLLTAREFADAIRLWSPRTAVRMARRGDVEAFLVGGRWLFPQRAVARLLDQHRNSPDVQGGDRDAA